MFCRSLAFALSLLLVGRTGLADERGDAAIAAPIAAARLPGTVRRFDIGVTVAGTRIPALITADDLDLGTKKTRVLLVGGLDGGHESTDSVLAVMNWFYGDARATTLREGFALSAVPAVEPDALLPEHRGGQAGIGYPPKGDAYGGEVPERQYLWRFIGMHAPDLVVVVGGDGKEDWTVPAAADDRLRRLGTGDSPPAGDEDRDLASALVSSPVANVGSIPAVHGRARGLEARMERLLLELERVEANVPSPDRVELQRRLARSPLEVATQLAKVYGHDLGDVAYIPAVALIGRVRLGELTNDATHEADVRRIVEPYRGTKPSLGKAFGGANVAGHLIFTELAQREPDDKWLAVVRRMIDEAYAPNAEGIPLKPHNEMSDAVFMGGPLLAKYAALSGEERYFELCVKQVRSMTDLNLRKDGLHRHSPLDETAWGRGNGFPALGLAMILEDFPEQHPDRPYLLKVYREHMAALTPHQDATGMWHQVVDHPGSYRELSCTSMITYAMLRGLRRGWLDRAEYEPVVRRAWPAINVRVAADGTLVDVCTGTGKQKSLRDYLDRKAILGKDARGGAMALLVATEMATFEAAQ